ncbi:hypothetical protein AcW1_008131 [Taiwanofungus camphoratus]|nr:hypothetical protein AcW1_008131 [Antrodia cinnamomea]KAI0955876.1 hypothetical protein AcV7_006419 [Antrodia cinnamomea]
MPMLHSCSVIHVHTMISLAKWIKILLGECMECSNRYKEMHQVTYINTTCAFLHGHQRTENWSGQTGDAGVTTAAVIRCMKLLVSAFTSTTPVIKFNDARPMKELPTPKVS